MQIVFPKKHFKLVFYYNGREEPQGFSGEYDTQLECKALYLALLQRPNYPLLRRPINNYKMKIYTIPHRNGGPRLVEELN